MEAVLRSEFAISSMQKQQERTKKYLQLCSFYLYVPTRISRDSSSEIYESIMENIYIIQIHISIIVYLDIFLVYVINIFVLREACKEGQQQK